MKVFMVKVKEKVVKVKEFMMKVVKVKEIKEKVVRMTVWLRQRLSKCRR